MNKELIIDGQIGPFSLNEPGGYGRNAAHNFTTHEKDALQALETGNADPIQALRKATIRYTPEGKMTFNDAFAYAEEEIKRFDGKTDDGHLDLDELTELFDGNAEFAQQYLKVVDRNQDSKVGAVELAAFLLFSDDAATLIAETIQAFEDTGSDTLIAPDERQELLETARMLKESHPTQLDGQVTASGRTVADIAVLSMSTFTGITIDSIIKNLKLGERYEQFKAAH